MLANLAPDNLTIDQYVADLRERIGTKYVNEWSRAMFGPKMPGPYHAFNTEAHPDSLRKFCDAVGDLNPIFRDVGYGETTDYGAFLMHPAFLYSVAYGHYPDPQKYAPPSQYQGLYGGDELKWFEVIKAGEKFDTVTTVPVDIQIKNTRTLGDVIMIYGLNEFFRRGTDHKLGECLFWTIQRKGAFHEREKSEPVRHTKEFVEQVHAEQDAEIIRGSLPRFWEDVNVGDDLQPVVRGPYTAMEAGAWLVGGMGERFFISDRLGRYIHETTGWSIWDEQLSLHKNFHEHTVGEKAMGAGAQRSSWVATMLTNWMGDAGQLRRLRTEHRLRGQFGNVYYAKGRVASKRVESEQHLVEIDCGVVNHAGGRHLIGSATIALPTRGG